MQKNTDKRRKGNLDRKYLLQGEILKRIGKWTPKKVSGHQCKFKPKGKFQKKYYLQPFIFLFAVNKACEDNHDKQKGEYCDNLKHNIIIKGVNTLFCTGKEIHKFQLLRKKIINRCFGSEAKLNYSK